MARDMLNTLETDLTRRQILKYLGGGLVSLGLLNLPFSKPASGAQQRPNIIFILSDDHRWDMLSCQNHPVVQTPNMDRLAREGVLFENAFVTTSLCSPSRASFLTGQYAHNHGVRNNMTPWDNANVTFLEQMKDAGYDTGFIGKWHMPGRFPRLRGVDRFVTFTVDGGQGRYFHCPLIVDGQETDSRKPYITEELTDYALDFISQKRQHPFCLYLSHKAVHYQFIPPPEFDRRYDDACLPLPGEADSWVGITNGNLYPQPLGALYRNYCECLDALDQQIGRLINRLDEIGMIDDTVIIYVGDNGFFFGEHHQIDKRWAYEESIRIPFIVRYPGLIRDPGRRAGQMVLNIDLAPTLLEIAGIPTNRDIDGRSLVAILKNRETPGRDAWLYEFFKDYPYSVPEQFALRTERFKYIEFPCGRRPELYDLVNDPQEKHNIIATPGGQSVLPELKRRLDGLKRGSRP